MSPPSPGHQMPVRARRAVTRGDTPGDTPLEAGRGLCRGKTIAKNKGATGVGQIPELERGLGKEERDQAPGGAARGFFGSRSPRSQRRARGGRGRAGGSGLGALAAALLQRSPLFRSLPPLRQCRWQQRDLAVPASLF